jgi:hypothetical protein
MKRLTLFVIHLVLAISMTSCGPGLFAEPTPTPTLTPTPSPTSTPTPTPTPTPIPTPTPTPIGGSNGQFIYTSSIGGKAPLPNGYSVQFSGSQLNRYDLNTSETTALINPAWMSEKLGKDIYRTEFLVAPDGRKTIVIAYTEIGWEEYGYSDAFEYYIASSDLDSLSPLLDVGARQIIWKWSPDSSMLLGLFVSKSYAVSIYTVNSDGSGLKKVIDESNTGIVNADWVGNQKIIYIQKGVPIVMNVDGTEAGRIGDSDVLIKRIFSSPDGEKIAYISTDNIINIANNDLSNEIPLGYYEDCDGNFPQDVKGWSNDNQYVVIHNTSCVFVKLFGQNIPSLIRRSHLVQIADGSIIAKGREEQEISSLCGWAPDNKFVYIMIEEKKSYLLIDDMENIGTSDPEFKMPYSGKCPIWMQ